MKKIIMIFILLCLVGCSSRTSIEIEKQPPIKVMISYKGSDRRDYYYVDRVRNINGKYYLYVDQVLVHVIDMENIKKEYQDN